MAVRQEDLVANRQPPSIQHAQQLLQKGYAEPARQMAEQVLKSQPKSVDAMVFLALQAKSRGDHQTVERHLRSALDVRPNDRQLLSIRAENFFQMGDPRRAIEECDLALKAFPGDSDFIKVKALSHDVLSEFDQALEVLGTAARTPDILAITGRVLYGLNRFEEAVALMRPVAEDSSQSPVERQRIWFQLAKTYDRIGAYDQAIDATAQAHAYSTRRFDPSAFQTYVDDLISTFDASNLRGLGRSSIRSQLPTFVIGMPRSGTTLVEQIIHAHPDGFGAGELLDIENAARAIPTATGSLHTYPHAVVDMTTQVADQLAAQYLARLRKCHEKATRIVNKMLEQYLHVGLIWLLLPGARIIHIRRDPLDNCLSCYTRHLNPNRMTYAQNLEHLGFVYQQHERLMHHWKTTLDLPFLTVQYEELVADQERITRQIIDFLGLPWDDRCLRYWEDGRAVMTLSYDQVNKPIYDSSIGRWRKYAKHLGPLRQALGMDDNSVGVSAE